MQLCPECNGVIEKNSYFLSYICNKCNKKFPIKEIEYQDSIRLLKNNGVKDDQIINSILNVAEKCNVTPKELLHTFKALVELSKDPMDIYFR